MLSTLLRLTLVVALLSLAPAKAFATPNVHHLHGGGTASISQVAMNVAVDESGSASGSFECLMAGRSAFVLGAFGLAHNMIVHATPTAGSVAGSTVTFSGAGSLILDGHVKMTVHVDVWVNVATQAFQLTVVDVGTLPVETFKSGGVALN
ncbi:MAG TPA: hypothetical protein VE693_10315 [Gaiellaceae bacterium]|jgi:hypothetical protein|nr:hypothetical protein [Gaiellaceae bacterium]